MADQQPPEADEKLCPYCAEVIKRAAIRCRYCHSDLAETTETTETTETMGATEATESAEVPSPQAGTGAPATETQSAEGPATPSPTSAYLTDDPEAKLRRPVPWWGRFPVTLGLLVLCLVLAGVTALSVERYHNPDAGKGPISSTSARENALTEAATLTQRVLSYNWQTLAADMKASEAVSAPTFRAEYVKAMSGVRAQTVKNQVKLTAEAVATSVVTASENKAVALVFVNQVTTAKGTTNQRLDQNRVLVTLTRDGGEWRVSKMDAF